MLFIVLIAQNTGDASITFLFWIATTSRIVLLAITFLVGIVVDFLLGRPWRRKKKELARVERAPRRKGNAAPVFPGVAGENGPFSEPCPRSRIWL